jgi:hypothetical protein
LRFFEICEGTFVLDAFSENLKMQDVSYFKPPFFLDAFSENLKMQDVSDFKYFKPSKWTDLLRTNMVSHFKTEKTDFG